MIVKCIQHPEYGINLGESIQGNFYIVYSASFGVSYMYFIQLRYDWNPMWIDGRLFHVASSVIPTNWHISRSQDIGMKNIIDDVFVLGYEEIVLTKDHYYHTIDGMKESDIGIFEKRKREIDDYLMRHELDYYRKARPKELWVEYD